MQFSLSMVRLVPELILIIRNNYKLHSGIAVRSKSSRETFIVENKTLKLNIYNSFLQPAKFLKIPNRLWNQTCQIVFAEITLNKK
jgi:hypothetical protein